MEYVDVYSQSMRKLDMSFEIAMLKRKDREYTSDSAFVTLVRILTRIIEEFFIFQLLFFTLVILNKRCPTARTSYDRTY